MFFTIFILFFVLATFPYFVRLLTLFYSRTIKLSSNVNSKNDASDFIALPKMSVILPVYNEEKVISRKMENLLSLSYPKDKLEVIVVDGESSDKTVSIVDSIKDERIILLKNKTREGVTQATKDGVRVSTGDVVVLTDTEALFNNDALELLAEDLENPQIGAITGVEVIVNPTENIVTQMEQTHRGFYNTLSFSESIVYSTSYFRGEFAAVRKSLFPVNIDSEKGILDVGIAFSAIRMGYKAQCDQRIKFYGLATNRLNDRNRQKIQRATLNQECMLQNRDLLFAPNFFGRVIFPSNFSIHIISPILFLFSLILFPFAVLEVSWQISILVLAAVMASCLIANVRNTLLTFIVSQVYLLIGLLKATIFGRPKFLKQVETTRRHFDVHQGAST
jgi:glycosyltransferase involved in cell wall biosynthesis